MIPRYFKAVTLPMENGKFNNTMVKQRKWCTTYDPHVSLTTMDTPARVIANHDLINTDIIIAILGEEEFVTMAGQISFVIKVIAIKSFYYVYCLLICVLSILFIFSHM